jgi:hypothetical protein
MLFKLVASKFKQKFQRKWGGDRIRGSQCEGDSDRPRPSGNGLDYLGGCLGGSDEANREKE